MPTVFCAILMLGLSLVGPSKLVGVPRQASANMDSQASQSKVACVDNSKRPSELPPPGPECAKQEFSKLGHPVMFPPHGGVAFGISSEPNKPSELHLWTDNQTDKTEYLYVCCISTVFDHIDVYDSQGHWALSKAEAAAKGRPTAEVCTCSTTLSIPPHIIEFVDSANISDGYSLPAGRYVITEKGSAPRPEGQTAPGQSAATLGLAITIP